MLKSNSINCSAKGSDPRHGVQVQAVDQHFFASAGLLAHGPFGIDNASPSDACGIACVDVDQLARHGRELRLPMYGGAGIQMPQWHRTDLAAADCLVEAGSVATGVPTVGAD